MTVQYKSLKDVDLNYDGQFAPSASTSAAPPRWSSTSSTINRMYTTQMLEYPMNVEEDPHQGHYILFEIMEQSESKLKAIAAEATKARKSQTINYDMFTGAETPVDRTYEGQHHPANKAQTALYTHQQSKKNVRGKYFINQIRNSTIKMDTCIALYMPPSISVSYGANYNETEIGILAETGGQIIQAFMDSSAAGAGAGAAAKAAVDAAGPGMRDAINKTALRSLDTIAPGAGAMIAMERGKIITPRMELMFSGIGRRAFSYEFTFIPKSRQEADRVEKIIKTFKVHMHSDFVDGNVREMKIPDYFNIRYMYRGEENSHLNKISTCVLTKMDVTYGDERYVSHEDGVPQTTKISLNFNEMEIITRDKIEAGF
jgi:hypothetical protein